MKLKLPSREAIGDRRVVLAYVALLLVAAAVYVAVFALRSSGGAPARPRWAIAPAAWGRLTTHGAEPCGRSAGCSLRIVLGPLIDKTHVFALETRWKQTQIEVQDNQPFQVQDILRYSAVLGCGEHIQGYGLDLQMLSGARCVPSAAKRGTTFWLHIANLLSQPRTVVITYYHA